MGIPQDRRKAVHLFEVGCNADNETSCFLAGNLYREGQNPISRDSVEALALLRKACEGNHAGGCANAGLMLIDGEGVPANVAAGASLLQKGCETKSTGDGELDDPRGFDCELLADQLASGEKLKKDEIRALAYYEKGCAMDSSTACRWRDKLAKKIKK